MELNFLPQWPRTENSFLLFGAILLVGIVGGELAQRTSFLPRITGFVATGLILGPSMLGLLDASMLTNVKPFTDIALGLILFQLGMQLDFKALRSDKIIIFSALVEAVLSFSLIFFVLSLFHVDYLHAALAAAIGISSSPAVVLLVIREFKADGPVTRRALDHVAINNVLAFFAYTILLPFLHYKQQADWTTIFLQPLYQALTSLVLAWFLAHACIRIARLLGRNENLQFALLVGLIISAIGLAKLFSCSNLLTLLALGIMARNLDIHNELMDIEFGHGGEIFFVLLFVIAGANLHLKELASVGWAAIAFVGIRFIGKTAGLLLLTPFSPLSIKQSSLLSLTLVPMAGLAIGLTEATSQLYPEFSKELSAIILGSVAILETVGPIVTEFALKRAGEVSLDQKLKH
ncbi:cation:proton antiporter [Ferrovum sp. PN-J185]|uniref:cation:proton antiporter n=1 Tax=Ferrovum sp. PN-J185 TaxID=1356306 RepID=UPI001E43314D|nr:cation:proton antiporter [Ferrovum sp. PN-J185]MCC6067649.1 cation:proton antiporter [Ferrovum sp. PN-J185]